MFSVALPVKLGGKRHGDTVLNNSKAEIIIILDTVLCLLMTCLLGSQKT